VKAHLSSASREVAEAQLVLEWALLSS
jgi:hypothetical protein